MRKKLLWISQLIIGAVLLLYAFFSARVFYDGLQRQAKAELKSYAALFDEEKYGVSEAGADALAEKLSGVRVTVFSADGAHVLGDSEKGEAGNHSDRAEIRLAIEKGEGYAVRSSGTVGKDMIYYCKASSAANGTQYLLRVGRATANEWQVMLDCLPTLGVFLALDFLLCLLFTYLATDYVVNPVRKMAKDAAMNVEATTKYPELQPVVDVLNKRNAEINEQFKTLKEDKALVERAQRSKNDFIANITHEMNTPLTSIRGYAELLERGVLDGEQARQAAQTILAQGERLSNLIACIINYNEIDNDDLPPYEVDVSRLAEEVLHTLAPSVIERGITLTTDIDENVTVVSRYERIGELLGNLIRNAIRYNKENGELFVSVKRGETGARLEVRDTGVGIAQENLERIFDRFFTVDKSHGGKNGGFGLGLAVVKKICNKAGWTLNVQSTFGEGTTFTVDF